jgi:hypothetical protein
LSQWDIGDVFRKFGRVKMMAKRRSTVSNVQSGCKFGPVMLA